MERVLDLVAVLALLAIYVWGFAGEASFPARLLNPIEVSATIAAGVAGTLLALMWILATHPERIGGLAAALRECCPDDSPDRVGSLASTFSSGFAAARECACTVPGGDLVLCRSGWHRDAGVDGHDRVRDPDAVPGTFLLQAMLVIGVAVPTPGGVGSFHEAYRIGRDHVLRRI